MSERSCSTSTLKSVSDLVKLTLKHTHSYQVGATPEKTEKAICSTNHKCKQIVDALSEDNKPHLKPDQGADPAAIFLENWRQARKVRVCRLNASSHSGNVQECLVQDDGHVGYKLLDAVTTAAEALAMGYGLKKNAFTIS